MASSIHSAPVTQAPTPAPALAPLHPPAHPPPALPSEGSDCSSKISGTLNVDPDNPYGSGYGSSFDLEDQDPMDYYGRGLDSS